MAPLVKLTDAKQEQLHRWIAQELKYPQMRDLMIDVWGYACTSQNVTWHRQNYAQKIQRMRMEYQNLAARRERDRQNKQLRRAGLAINTPHCATCQCHALAKAG